MKLRKSEPPVVMLSGSVMLVMGALLTFGAILSASVPVLLFGTALAGLGFGPAFLGAYRTIVVFAPPDDRAGLVAAIYTVNNLAFGIPALIAGVTATHYGLHETALVYSLVVAALAGLGAGSFPLLASGLDQRRLIRRFRLAPEPAQGAVAKGGFRAPFR